MGDTRNPEKQRLADSGLPPRVRELATRMLQFVRAEQEERLQLMLGQLETHLFKQAERARNPAEQTALIKSVQAINTHRQAFQSAYFAGVESRLARLRQSSARRARVGRSAAPSSEWALSESMPDEDIQAARVRDLATPLEAASSLPLYLLGQRFGVLAGSPALAAEAICLGPRVLIELAGEAATATFTDLVPVAVLQSHFHQGVLGDYPQFADRLNQLLDEAGVLPGLTYVPVRPTKASRAQRPADATPTEATPATRPNGSNEATSGKESAAPAGAAGTAGASGTGGTAGIGGTAGTAGAVGTGGTAGVSGNAASTTANTTPATGFATSSAAVAPASSGMPMGSPGTSASPGAATPSPATGPAPADDVSRWLGQPEHAPLVPTAMPVDFRHLQQLLTAQRIAGKMPTRPPATPGAALQTPEVDRLLGEIQATPPADASAARSIHGIREELLQRAHQEGATKAELERDDADTFDVLSLLFKEVAREIRVGSSVHGLLERLQLPILRLALQDRRFFDQADHPGRQLLNTIAESDASAYGENSADPFFEAAMHKAVARMEDDFSGQPEMLALVNDELQTQFRQQIKRSQASEKRWIDAARGRERMAIAKKASQSALDTMIAAHGPPRTTEVLLRRAWVDVMTLTALRHGDESPSWQGKLDLTRKILETVSASEPVQSPMLGKAIESAMRSVGYHQGEAAELARHLSRSASVPRGDDESSATELSARIKAHTRLGEDDSEEEATRDNETIGLGPRNALEQECYEYLRNLPFGSWLDFVMNQQGEVERRRFSWYSSVTDRALFVNRRGQRVGEIPMDALARLMAQRQLKVVDDQQLRLVDRAFRSTIDRLKQALRGRSDNTPAPWSATA